MQDTTKSSSFVKRHVAAFFIVPLLVGYIYFLPPRPYFLALILLVGMAAMREFFVMYNVPSALCRTGVVTGGALLYIFCVYPDFIMLGIFAGISIVMLLRLFSEKNPSGSMSDVGPLGVGFLYIAGCMSFQWFLREAPGIDGLKYIFALYMSVWIADSMAFYIGTYLGRNRLYPSVSPRKTVEGAFGSVIGGILGIAAARVIFNIDDMSLPAAAATGAVMGVTSMVGDLIESMFKRDAGIKDSGGYIPGHGGILDKLDGMLLSAPVLYLIARYF